MGADRVQSDKKQTSQLRLIDLVSLANITLKRFKIHCATGRNPTPIEAFYDGKFKQWQEYQNRRNFQCDRVLSLIHLGGSDWLFAGVFDVVRVEPQSNGQKSWFQYTTSEVSGLEHLVGRVIITFRRKFRASYLKGPRYGEALIVKEILAERHSIGEFPGYNKVCLSFRNLKTVIRQETASWKTALGNVAGVYLIADEKSGKQYVGSAYGDVGIWQRWCAYAESGHGGNRELKQLLSKEGSDYANNFLFTILEVIDLNASKEYVTGRESHWKDALLTRKYGYNSN